MHFYFILLYLLINYVLRYIHQYSPRLFDTPSH